MTIFKDMSNYIYSLYPPITYDDKKEMHGHLIFFKGKKTYIIPSQFTKKIITPSTFYYLKKEFKIDSITIIDKIIGSKKEVCIINHINKSGYNFLHNSTPFKDYPTFPDISFIYNIIEKLDPVVVHTVGPKRFEKNSTKGVLLSEMIGLIAPVWSYVEVLVYGKSKIT